MKKIIFILIGVFAVQAISIAQDVVAWSYSAKKISDKVYEIHLKATIRDGWHLYSQQQPENFIGRPTKIKFNKHALFVFASKVEEVGTLQKSKEPVLETEAWQYTHEVDFVQKVTLSTREAKAGAVSVKNIKTSISGTIEFQVCTNEKCLPPATAIFNIAIE